jgi:hypothetical protein
MSSVVWIHPREKRQVAGAQRVLACNPFQITNENFTGLSRLCQEFVNEVFANRVWRLWHSPDFLHFSEIEVIETCAQMLKFVRQGVFRAMETSALEK